jgi:hypothetical protein
LFDQNGWGDPCTFYVLLYDVTDAEGRKAAARVEKNAELRRLILDMASPWHNSDFLIVRRATPSIPVEGEICRRFLEDHPPGRMATLEDVPTPRPGGSVELMERHGYWLTPIEVPFYDALRETGLFFAVQPWIQGD